MQARSVALPEGSEAKSADELFGKAELASAENGARGHSAGPHSFVVRCVTGCAHMGDTFCCKLELVIWGATYPNRLWCIRELFTLAVLVD